MLARLPYSLPLAALIASLVRWWLQGSGNLYTATHKRFYVPDPDIGWVESKSHPIWLGLEVCAIVAAIAVGVALAGWIIRRRERTSGARAIVLRAAVWIVAVMPMSVPIAAFASGSAPANGRSLRPSTPPKTIESPGIAGTLQLPAGTYDVVASPGSSISARISAGGEAFDAVFANDITGSWQGDPRDLAQPTSAEISVPAASVNTGVRERTKHARDSYLQAGTYPRVIFTLGKLLAAKQDGPSQIAFRANGTVGLIGKVHGVEVTGTLRQPDAAVLAHLGTSGDVLLVQADFALAIHDTALAPDAGDFDGDRIPIHVSLVLRNRNRSTR